MAGRYPSGKKLQKDKLAKLNIPHRRYDPNKPENLTDPSGSGEDTRRGPVVPLLGRASSNVTGENATGEPNPNLKSLRAARATPGQPTSYPSETGAQDGTSVPAKNAGFNAKAEAILQSQIRQEKELTALKALVLDQSKVSFKRLWPWFWRVAFIFLVLALVGGYFVLTALGWQIGLPGGAPVE